MDQFLGIPMLFRWTPFWQRKLTMYICLKMCLIKCKNSLNVNFVYVFFNAAQGNIFHIVLKWPDSLYIYFF